MKTFRKMLGVTLVLAMILGTDAIAQRGKGRKDDDRDRRKEYRHYPNQQGRHHAPRYESHRRPQGPPPWARAYGYNGRHHVYFPDYQVFYDARRHAYIYRDRRGWVTSRQLPYFMARVDMRRVRVQMMAQVPLHRHQNCTMRTIIVSTLQGEAAHRSISMSRSE